MNISRGHNPYTNEDSERLSFRTDEWDISINRYGGDNDKVQVLITSLKNDDVEIAESVPMDRVDGLIQEVTGISRDDYMRGIASG